MIIDIQEKITLHGKQAISTGAKVSVEFNTKDENTGRKMMTSLIAAMEKLDQDFPNVT